MPADYPTGTQPHKQFAAIDRKLDRLTESNNNLIENQSIHGVAIKEIVGDLKRLTRRVHALEGVSGVENPGGHEEGGMEPNR